MNKGHYNVSSIYQNDRLIDLFISTLRLIQVISAFDFILKGKPFDNGLKILIKRKKQTDNCQLKLTVWLNIVSGNGS